MWGSRLRSDWEAPPPAPLLDRQRLAWWRVPILASRQPPPPAREAMADYHGVTRKKADGRPGASCWRCLAYLRGVQASSSKTSSVIALPTSQTKNAARIDQRPSATAARMARKVFMRPW